MRGLAKFCVDFPAKWNHYQQEKRYNNIIKDARNRTDANNKGYETLIMRQTRKHVDVTPIVKSAEERACDISKFNEVVERLEKRRYH